MAARPGGGLRRRPRPFYRGLRERLTAALLAHARHQFRLARRQPDGGSLGEHLEALHRATGRRHPLLDPPPPPAAAAHVWAWFLDLHAARPPGRPLAFAEIDAWARLTGETPAPWELAALRALDRAWLEVACS